MMCIINKLFNPVRLLWPEIRWWKIVPAFNMIDARFLEELEIDLKRVRLLERLRIVRLFVFRGVAPKTFITRDGVQVSQNRWVYDKALTVLPADRVMVLAKDQEGLPAIPKDYRWLNTRENPPSYYSFWTDRKLLEGETFV